MKNQGTNIGLLVRKLRQDAKLTQDQLAWKTQLSRSYIQHLENGRTRDLKVSTLRALCSGLGITVVEFFKIEDENEDDGLLAKKEKKRTG